MRKLLYVFYPFALWWDYFKYFAHLNAQVSMGSMNREYEPYDFSQDTAPKLKKYIHSIPPAACCGTEVQPFGHGDPRVTRAARRLLKDRNKV